MSTNNTNSTNNTKVELLHYTPLWVCSDAIRTCWDSKDKSDTIDYVIGEKDKELIDRIGNKFKHRSTLEHVIIFLNIRNPDTEIIEFFKNNEFSKLTQKDDNNIVRTNLRVLVENNYFLRDICYQLKDSEFGYLLGKTKILKNFPNYRIYSYGIVEKYKTSNKHDHRKVPMIIKSFVNKYGYIEYILNDINENRKHKSLHRILMETFYPDEMNEHVNHKNGNKLDNSLENLEWCTASENEQHSYSILGKEPWNKGVSKGDNCLAKPIHQVSLDGKILKTFPSALDAIEYMKEQGIKISSGSISDVCNGNNKTAKGYIWRFANES